MTQAMNRAKYLLAILAAAILALALAVPAHAATADDKVTVNGIASGDTVKLYKVLEPDQTSSNGWAVTSAFSKAITSGEAVDGITEQEAGTLANAASGDASYSQSASGASVEISVDPGLYLVVVVPGDSSTIYNPAFVASDYVSTNQSNTIDLTTAGYSSSAVLKKATITVDKKANGEDNTDKYSVGDTVPFTITTTMPSYPSNANNATMEITDSPVGLEIQTTDITVTVDGASVNQGETTYTLTANATSLKVAFAKSYILANPGKAIVVSYNATLTSVDALSGEASNTAKVKFNQNPNTSATSEPSDTVNEKTYGIVFQKVDNTNAALPGAVFTLYTGDVTDSNGKVDASKATADVVAGAAFTSGDNGYVYWSGLKAGTYTIVETTTPAGYVTAAPVKVTISSASATNDNPATEAIETNFDTTVQTITNVPGAELPSTGGMGTTILYIVGGVLILGAGVVLVAKRRMANRRRDEDLI